MDIKMNTMIRTLGSIACGVLVCTTVLGGNPDRAGQAGASQLLMNPWARSSGWGLANTATLRGVESMYGNIAGLAHTNKTEITFTNTTWLSGSGVSMNAIGLGQKMGESGVLGLTATVLSFGDLPVTTDAQPEGGLGTFSPTMSNIGLAYAKSFSNSIYGGLLVRVVSESIANVRATGVCFDAGIHYVTGEKENIKFGIALKNVGPPMRFAGDGLGVQGLVSSGSDVLTLQQRSERFELPSMLTIGAAYDFHLNEMHRLTVAGTFISNSFTQDQGVVGLEYAFKKIFHLRGGYLWEKGNTTDERTSVFTGPSGGLSVDFPFGSEKKSAIAVDYAYRATNPFAGVHCIGLRVSL